MIVLCCYCRRQRIGGEWLAALPPPVGQLVSHGICDDCYRLHVEPQLEEVDDNGR